MCNCRSCKLTDSYSDKGFAAWPKGENINRSGRKDKVYAAHWNYCGAEAHQKRENLDMRMHFGSGKAISIKDTANREAYLIHVPDEDVWIPIFQWERESGENYLDRYNQMKSELNRKAA